MPNLCSIVMLNLNLNCAEGIPRSYKGTLTNEGSFILNHAVNVDSPQKKRLLGIQDRQLDVHSFGCCELEISIVWQPFFCLLSFIVSRLSSTNYLRLSIVTLSLF